MWSHEHQTTSEDGNPEVWTFFYKRFNGHQMTEFINFISEDIDDSDNIERTYKLAEMCIRRVERNGAPYEVPYPEWHFDVLNVCVENHNTFRDLITAAREQSQQESAV